MTYNSKKEPIAFIRSNDYNVIDDQSGFKIRASQTILNYNNRVVKTTDLDPVPYSVHPKALPMQQPIDSLSSEPTDVFVDTSELTWDDTTKSWS